MKTLICRDLYHQYLKAPTRWTKSGESIFASCEWWGVTQPGVLGEDRASDSEIERLARVLQLIDAYRERGHFQATLDPLGIIAEAVAS